MALILKDGKTFNPAISSAFAVDMANGDYYGAIDSIQYDKQRKDCNFSVDIYGSAESHSIGGAVVDRVNFNLSGEDFIGNDGLSIPGAYEIALQDARFENWKGDE